MAIGIRTNWEPMKKIGFADIGAVYIGVGTPLTIPARWMLIQNLTDVLLTFSWNAVDDHFELPKRSFLLIDVTSNKSVSTGLYQEKRDRLYVKHNGVAPTEERVNFSAFGAIDD